jgi:acetylornithine/LysW-gamma-L-lysine aminotransferase
MAGGLPIGAVLIGGRVGQLPTGSHGTTFGGNPLVCAASLAALETLKNERLPQRAAEMGDYLISRLRELPSLLIREVRGMGFMIGVELKVKVAPYLNALMAEGVLALSAGMTVIRLLPPLVITRPQVDQVVESLAQVLENEQLAD